MRTSVTQSIAFQPEVLAAIKAAAEKDRRSVSAYINNHFADLLLSGQAPPPISTDMKPAPARKPARR